MITFGSLFAGIGGFDLGFERAGMVCKWQVEIDDYATRVLEKHWPDVTRWRDVRQCFDMPTVDGICGGFPCQDLSSANTRGRKKLDGKKSGLWNELKRIIECVKPKWVCIENVANWRDWVPSVRLDLWRLGYTSLSFQLCASQFGAYHKRPRVFVFADSNSKSKSLSTIHEKVASLRQATGSVREQFEDIAGFVPRTDGVSQWMARAYGNSLSPIVSEWIGRRIVESIDL